MMFLHDLLHGATAHLLLLRSVGHLVLVWLMNICILSKRLSRLAGGSRGKASAPEYVVIHRFLKMFSRAVLERIDLQWC